MDKLNTLRALMKTHDMKSNDVAELLCVEVQTVQAWLSVGQTRPIPDRQLQLLKRLLKAQ
jgi:DNA-binding transcriptional regulator YiaG